VTVRELKLLLESFPEDYDLEFLCPDGYTDDITEVVAIDNSERSVTFLSYIQREHRKGNT
jgi:hypothetical protein